MTQAILSMRGSCGKFTFHSMGTRAERIKKVREIKKLSQEKFAAALGLERGAVGNWELGKGIKMENLSAISRKFGVPLNWLANDEGQWPHEDDPPDFEVIAPTRPKQGILEIDVRVGLGGGGSLDHQEVRHDGNYADPVKDEAWQFPTRFIREELRAPQDRIIIMEAFGDSMTPTILSGDRVIVDTSHRIPTPDGIYALRDRYNNIIVKRLQVLRRGDPPRINIISDNSHHPVEEVGADEIEIVGRVLWSLKRL